MIELLEYLSEEDALKGRTEQTAPFIKRYFADAGTNPVRAFNDDDKNRSGYIFFENTEGAGRYFMFVTLQVNANPDDEQRWKRQFTHLEWFTGSSSGVSAK